ncbi:MAG: hypothetical protein WCY36_06210 [Candidatus Omnitrophota bacterium]
MAQNYRLKIVNGDRHFEAEGDKKFVLDMWKKFQGHDVSEQLIASKEKGQKELDARVNVISQGGKSVSVGEFILKSGLKSHTDIVLAFGYYLEKYSGMKQFGPADINKCYYDAKMESSNTSQMLIQNIKSGRIMQAKSTSKGGQKYYTLTRTGEDAIEKAMNKKSIA